MSELFIIGHQQEAKPYSYLTWGNSFGMHQNPSTSKTRNRFFENRPYTAQNQILEYINRVVSQTPNEIQEAAATEVETLELETNNEFAHWLPTSLASNYNRLNFWNIEPKRIYNQATKAVWNDLMKRIDIRIEPIIQIIPEPENAIYIWFEKRETSIADAFCRSFLKNFSDAYANLTTYKYLYEMLQDLTQLLVDEDYSEDYLKPTDYAHRTMKQLLTSVKPLLKCPFPRGTIYPDGDGGLRVEWMREGIELRLIISATENDTQYIYHELANIYAVEYNVMPDNLSNWLEWFNRNDPSK